MSLLHSKRRPGAHCAPGQGSAYARRAGHVAATIAAIFALFGNLTRPALAAPPLGVNGDADWVNLINGLAGWGVAEDASGWPMADCQIVPIDARHNMPWDGPDPGAHNDDVSGVYLLSFNGKATIGGYTETASVTVQHQQYNSATNTTTAQIVMPPNQWLMVLQFTNTQRTAAGSVGAGFTNMKLIRPGYPLNITQVFTTASLSAYGPAFSAIRAIGIDGVNSYQDFSGTSLIPVQWADRVKVTDAYQGGTIIENDNTAPGHQAHGWAWELIIALCNQTHRDLWLNIPAGASDDYVTQLANLLKDGDTVHGVSYPGLDPNLHVYLEYSNEVWNFSFPQYVWNAIAAENEVAAGGSPLNNDGSTDKQVWHFRRVAERLYQVSNLFKTVYGADAINTTIRPVFLWQYDTAYQPPTGDSVWGPSTASVLAWFKTTFGPPNQYFYGCGIAPYYGPYDTSSVNNILNTSWTGSDQTRARFIAWQALATFYGLKQVGYESGNSLGTGFGGGATRDPRITAGEVHHFLENWFAVGGDEVNFFALRGSVSPWGDWLAVEDYDHLNTPKMQGILDILSAPLPPLSAGHVLPTTAGQAVSIDASQWEESGNWPGTRETISPPTPRAYLLRVVEASTFSISLFGHQDSADIQEQILVDNKALGTVTLPTTTDGATSVVSVTLGPGQHTVQIGYNYTGATSSDHAEPAAVDIQLTSGGGAAIVPSAPANPVVTSVSTGTVNLLWGACTTTNGYHVYRSVTSGSSYKLVASPTVNRYTDTGLTEGKTYYYVITAENAAGESAYSPQFVGIPTRTSAPAPPTNLKIVSALNGVVSITWTGNSETSYYKIYRSITKGSGYSNLGSQFANNYTDGNTGPLAGGSLTNGTTYYYVVTGDNGYGESAYSKELAVTPASQTPPAPTGVSAVAANGRVELNWTPPAGQSPQFSPMQYTVYRSTTSGSGYQAVINTSVANAIDVGLANGTTYYYVVAANNGAGTGAYSAQVKATPTAAGVISINCGGAAIGAFVADTDDTGGKAISTTSAIDTTLLLAPAPQAVYQTARQGTSASFTYTIKGLLPNGLYTVLLHFAEISPSVTAAGEREFDVLINKGQVLTNFDIVRLAGAPGRAIDEKIPVSASSTGQIVIQFHGVTGVPLINGIEVW